MTTGRPAGYSAISNYSRVEILHLVQHQPQRTVSELVSATKLHPNTVREHLQRLIDDGYVVSETEHRTTRGRPRVLYSASDGVTACSPVQRRKARAAAERGDLTPLTQGFKRLVEDYADTSDLVSDDGFFVCFPEPE